MSRDYTVLCVVDVSLDDITRRLECRDYGHTVGWWREWPISPDALDAAYCSWPVRPGDRRTAEYACEQLRYRLGPEFVLSLGNDLTHPAGPEIYERPWYQPRDRERVPTTRVQRMCKPAK